MARRVLLASMDAGGGHDALRDSLHAALRQVDPGERRFEPVAWNSANRLIGRLYAFIVHRLPGLQQAVFDVGRYDWGVRLSASVTPRMLQEARSALLQMQPDVVVTTHWLLSLLFARARASLGLSVPLVSAIPDYGVPIKALIPQQAALRSDYVVVMERTTRTHLIRERTFAAERVCYAGFLTRDPFVRIGEEIGDAPRLPRATRSVRLRELRREHPQLSRLDPCRRTVIFLAGSAWIEKTAPVIEALLAEPAVPEQVNAIVVCGRNVRFRKTLLEKLGDHPRFSVFGFVTPSLMAQLMALADVPVLGSLAPATLQELLEVRCGPLLVHRFIPGAEAPHVPYVEANAVGLYEPDPRRMLACIKQALTLAPAEDRVSRLLTGFPTRAAEIRRRNKERALRFPRFLGRIHDAMGRPDADGRCAGVALPIH